MNTVRQNAKSISINSPFGTILFLIILQSCTLDFSVQDDYEPGDMFGEGNSSDTQEETDTDPLNPTESSCEDGMQNGDETGLDCGGSCPACPGCEDGMQNGDETGLDCGGSCPSCSTCVDGIQNGGETGVDCGGNCPACGNPVFSSPTPDISIPAACFAPDEDILITKHHPSFFPILDWVWVPDDKDWWSRMPKSKLLYRAPEKNGSYEMKFYWCDAADKNWRSRLTFQVSNSCP